MRNFNKIITICTIFFLLYPQSSKAQIGKIFKSIKSTIGKAISKESTESAGKNIAKKGTKQVTSDIFEKAMINSISARYSKKSYMKATQEFAKEKIPATVSKRLSKELGNKIFIINNKNAVVNKAAKNGLTTQTKLRKAIGTKESINIHNQNGHKQLGQSSYQKSIDKNIVKNGLKHTGKEALDILNDVPEVKESVLKLMQKIPAFNEKSLEVVKNGKTISIGFKNTHSKIIIDNKGIIHANTGSLNKKGINNMGANEFLNNSILPNKTYILDDGLAIYKTDNLGRTIFVKSNSAKYYNYAGNGIRGKLGTEQKKALLESYKGYNPSTHDAGHLQSYKTGGPNEKMNLLPMKREKQRAGSPWFKLESKERKYIREGSDVVRTQTIKYNPDGSYIINVVLEIKKKNGKVKVINEIFDDLY